MHFETLFDLRMASYRLPEVFSMLILLPAMLGMVWGAKVLFSDDWRARVAYIWGWCIALFISLVSTAMLIHDWRAHNDVREAFLRQNYKVLEGPIAALMTTRTAKGVVRTRINVDGATFRFGERENEQGLKEADLPRLGLAQGDYVRITHFGSTILRLERRWP
jgi:hypothetical protein